MNVLFLDLSLDGVSGVGSAAWWLAISPILLLLLLVLWGRLATWLNASITFAYTVVIALVVFDSAVFTMEVGTAKGAWVGVWILYVIVPALFMHHLATQIGMVQLGKALSALMPTPTGTVLLLAWVLPSFLQGVSGFGTPVAVAAPLLLALGIDKVKAVALVLVGYHWSVGFGSMGSSFYMGAFTARLDAEGTQAFAAAGALMLGTNAVLAGVLVSLLFDGLKGLREGLPVILVVGPTMAVVQWLAVQVEPGIGSLSAGAAGIGAMAVVRLVLRRTSARSAATPTPVAARSGGSSVALTVPDGESAEAARLPEDPEEEKVVRGRARAAAVPYVLLATIALVLFLPPAVRDWVRGNFRLGPSFPSTTAADGGINEAVRTYNPIALFGHPGSFLLAASVASILVWWLWGRWSRATWRAVWPPALKQSWKTGPSVILLAALAGVLVDTGMVTAIAEGASETAGEAYPLVAPVVGALGSFITGSTTNSNALFSALQASVADLLGMRPTDLLASQLAGGNIGNALAPVVVLLGLSAVGASREVGRVLRLTIPSALVLMCSTVLITWLLVTAHG